MSFSDTSFETSTTILHALEYYDKTWTLPTSRSPDYPLIWSLMEFAYKWDFVNLYETLLPYSVSYYRQTLVPFNVEDLKPFLMLARHGQLDPSVAAFSKAAVTWTDEGWGGETDPIAGYSFLDPKGWPFEMFELCPPDYLWALLKVMSPYGLNTPVQEDRKRLRERFVATAINGWDHMFRRNANGCGT